MQKQGSNNSSLPIVEAHLRKRGVACNYPAKGVLAFTAACDCCGRSFDFEVKSAGKDALEFNAFSPFQISANQEVDTNRLINLYSEKAPLPLVTALDTTRMRIKVRHFMFTVDKDWALRIDDIIDHVTYEISGVSDSISPLVVDGEDFDTAAARLVEGLNE